MKTPSIVLPIALIAIASQAQIAPAPYLCKYEDVHNLMRQPTGDLRMQTSGFQFPAKIKVHPARGWFHGQDADFLNPGPGLEATSYPGTLRLAPVSTSTALSRDFESGLQGMTATGAFRVYSDLAFGYGSNRSARIECNSTGTGNINLINTQTDTAIYREFEMYYYADPDFPGFTLIAKVKIGLATTDVSLIDIRFDRGEDGAPSYNNEWRQLRLDINGLLAARGHPNAVITNLRITNSVTATGPKMWIDNMRMFGGAYPDFTDYLSPPRRMDQPYPFDTFYWSKSRTFWSPFAAVELGQSGTGLQFQIRSGPTRVECESAPWYGPTSDTDWYTTDDLLCGFQAINPVHNGDTWVQVRARLISSPDHLHTPVLEDFCVTWGDANTWDIMGLILKAVDADYQDANGVTQHETSSMTQADVDDLSNQWQFFIRYAPRFMSYNLKLRSELHVVDSPLTTPMISGSNNSYTIDPSGALPLYQQWVGTNKWDSITFNFRWTKIGFPAWGLAWYGNWIPGNAMMNQIIYIGSWAQHHEVMLHEWMHSLAWTCTDRTDDVIPHPHSDQDPHWATAGIGLASMDYYYHCLAWHGFRQVYDSIDAVDPVNSNHERVWGTLGAFTFSPINDDGLFTDYIGEAFANPWYNEPLGGKNWSSITSSSDFINLGAKYGGTGGRVAYGSLYFKLPKDQTVRLWTGSDDGFRLWFNNDLMRSRHAHRGAAPGTDATALDAGEGWNHLLMKVENYSGSWGYYARLSDYQGNAIPGLETAYIPPGYSGFENLTGKVDLSPFQDPTTVRLQFVITDPSSGEVQLSRWIFPSADGSYKLSPVPRGTYKLQVRGPHWLSKTVPITVGTGDLGNVDIELVNGDVDGSNSIDLVDMNQFFADYGSNKYPETDLDGNGIVGIEDLTIILLNFAQVGT